MDRAKRTRCPRCRGSGKGPANHERGFELEEDTRGRRVVVLSGDTGAPDCNLCDGQGSLSATRVQLIRGDYRT